MFASTFNRTVRMASSQIRRYATETTQSSSSSRAAIFGGTAIVAGAGTYYFLDSQRPPITSATTLKQHILPPSKKVFTGGDQGFISLKLAEVEQLSHNTKRLRFSFEDDNAVSGLAVASALITKYQGPEMKKPVIRPYTPVSDEDTRGHMDFIIKRYEGGAMSMHLCDMKPGQRLDIKGPIPKYPWEQNKHKHVALIAGGTGITPMWQLCRAIFNNPEDKTQVTMVFGNVSDQDILLKHELGELENEYPDRFRAFYVLDNPPEGWTMGKGRVTKELLKTVLPSPDKENIKVFVCGPPPMYKAISGEKKSPSDQGELGGFLNELGYSKDQVYKF